MFIYGTVRTVHRSFFECYCVGQYVEYRTVRESEPLFIMIRSKISYHSICTVLYGSEELLFFHLISNYSNFCVIISKNRKQKIIDSLN